MKNNKKIKPYIVTTIVSLMVIFMVLMFAQGRKFERKLEYRYIEDIKNCICVEGLKEKLLPTLTKEQIDLLEEFIKKNCYFKENNKI